MSDPYSLLASLESVKDLSHPPIHLWNPDNVKDIDMEIKRDGTWFYMGTPIERARLVRLFSTVLRREDDGEYYLVTPVEKCRIQVEDVPFTAILLNVAGEGRDQELSFTTNVADIVIADETHPIHFETHRAGEDPLPYVTVRNGLDALLSRNVYYELTDLLDGLHVDGESWQGVWSSGTFFKFIRTEQLN